MRLKHLAVLLAGFLGIAANLHAQAWTGVLAPTRAVDWSRTGVVGGIPDANWTQCGSTIAAYGSSGAPQSASTISNAIAACPANTYLLLGPGTFYLSDGVLIQRSNVVLRGSGPSQTTLKFSGHNGCGGWGGEICVKSTSGSYSGGPDNVANWTAGYAQGSTSITLSANISGNTPPFVGASLILDQIQDGTTRASDTGNVFMCTNNPACTVAGGGSSATRDSLQMVTITAIQGGSCTSGCTVSITPGLYMPNWKSTRSPQVWWASVPNVSYVGIENLKIDSTTDATANGGGNGVQLYNAQNSWVKNCSIGAVVPEPVTQGGTFRGVEGLQSHHLTIRDNYFFGRALWDSYGTDFWIAGDSLIENNIMQFVPIPFMCENCFGNAYTYNFTVNNYWGNPGGTWAMPSFYHHGGVDSYVLIDGNVGFGVKLEDYYGQAFFYTAFRNRFFGWQNTNQSNQTVPVMAYSLNRYHNFVGNVLGWSGFHNQYQITSTGSTANSGGSCVNSIFAIGLGGECGNGDNSGHPYNDMGVLGTIVRWGNFDTVGAVNRFVAAENGSTDLNFPALSSPISTLPPSLVYTSKPAWWPAGKAWPTIGPDISGGNIGRCSGGTYDKWPATAASQCTGGSLASEGTNGQAISIPAMDCYLGVMNGRPDGAGGPIPFNPSVCYPSGPPPNRPGPSSGLATIVN